MLHTTPHVAAIAVIDLARELKRHSIIDAKKIRDLHPQLIDHVNALEQHNDISSSIDSRYPESILMELWQLADKDLINKDIGVRIGAKVSPETQGLLSNLLLHCDTLGEVLNTYLEKISLVNASETWVIQQKHRQLELLFSFTPGKNYPRCAVERSMVSLHQLAQYYCQRKISLSKVEFNFPKPAYSMQLQHQFSCDIYFNSHRNALTVPEEAFSYTLPLRNQYIKNMIEKRISDLNLLKNSGPTANSVRELFRKDMAEFCAIDQLAKTLHMSRTTLYRRLKNEETSFSTLLDEERQRLLVSHQHDSIAETCDLLGFKDPSAYYKARKRWVQGNKMENKIMKMKD